MRPGSAGCDRVGRQRAFFRTADGLECDLLYRAPAGLAAVEVESGSTIAGAWFAGLRRIERTVGAVRCAAVVYGGDQSQARSDGAAVPLAAFSDCLHSLHHPAQSATDQNVS